MPTDSANSTALHITTTQGHTDVGNLPLDADSNLAKIARKIRKTVLHTAARMGHLEVAKFVLTKDPSIDFRIDKKGQTALHMAVKGQNVDMLVELIKPDPTVLSLEDNKGNIALHIATKTCHTKGRALEADIRALPKYKFVNDENPLDVGGKMVPFKTNNPNFSHEHVLQFGDVVSLFPTIEMVA